jgi:hypothetical protein
LHRGAHGGHVCAEIEDVGSAEKYYDAVEHGSWIVFSQVRGYANSGYPSETATNLLNRRHQRKREEHGPQHAVPELRANLRISRYAARIVIGRSGD